MCCPIGKRRLYDPRTKFFGQCFTGKQGYNQLSKTFTFRICTQNKNEPVLALVTKSCNAIARAKPAIFYSLHFYLLAAKRLAMLGKIDQI
jgi:hypothetical protein